MKRQTSFLSALKWSYISDLGEKILQASSNFILAALLGPSDFGTVIIAWIYVGFARMFLDQGLVCALIQKKDLDREHIDSVFSVNIVLSVFLVAASILGARWWEDVNHAPGLAHLIAVLSITIPLEAMSVVPRALIHRQMDFKSLAVRANASVLVSGIIGIVLAFMGYGAWALIWQQIAATATSVPLLWAFCPWRPRFGFSWRHFRSLLGFSASNFAVQLALAAETQAGSVLLGIFVGPEAVGLYRFADRLVATVVGTTTNGVHTVSLPEFSRLQGQPDELRRSVLACLRLSATLTLPALSGLAVVAGPLVHLVGPRWAPATDVLAILSVVAMVMIFASFTSPLLQAIGKPHRLAVLEWSRTGLSIALFLIAGVIVRHAALDVQLLGFSVSRLVLGVLVVAPVFIAVLLRTAGIPLRQLGAEIAPSVAASVCCVAAVLLLYASGIVPQDQYLVRLTSAVVIGGSVGSLVLLALDRPARGIVASVYRRRQGLRASSRA
jgi:O-antigen/teichoic acid export membrane protein